MIELRLLGPRAIAFSLAIAAATATAAPRILRVDATLANSSGAPVTGTTKDIQVKLYDALTSGTLLWTSSVSQVTVTTGRFSLSLDATSGSPTLVDRLAALSSSTGAYFEIIVDGGTADGAMNSSPVAVNPRTKAKGTAFALVAAAADSLYGVTATTTEINTLAGVTGSLAKTNSFTATEATYLAGVTASIQTQFRSLANVVKFGGSGWRPAPTTGTLTGEYWTSGAWATTGAIVCNRCRLRFDSSVAFNHAVTVNTEASSDQGYGAPRQFGNGSGGAFGGAGGVNGGLIAGGKAYPLEWSGFGSGGGDGNVSGGGGGGGFYVEAVGGVTVAANISANGGNGTSTSASTAFAGGGGSGGAIVVRSLATVIVQTSVTLAANGGTGGTGSGVAASIGGGGGGGGYISLRGATVSTTGASLQVTGGSGGTGSLGANGGAGATGSSSTANEIYGPMN